VWTDLVPTCVSMMNLLVLCGANIGMRYHYVRDMSLRMPLLLRGRVKPSEAAIAIFQEDGKSPRHFLGPLVHSWGS